MCSDRSNRFYPQLTSILEGDDEDDDDDEPDGAFTFSGSTSSDNVLYEVKLELYDKVNAEARKLNTGVRSIFCVIEKAEKGWWKKLLRSDVKLPHYIKVDWDKWAEEDEDDDFGGMDFSKFGNMGGMDGDDDLDVSDDEEAETTKTEDGTEALDVEKKVEEVSEIKEETEKAPST
ncbi:uncharacterized protein OsI_027940-like [Dendrobium catenatum]|uniref:Co-chaperone protein p23 n=1 Tax=Dendrobium catenatum TaxID=906689 RepID=A0A2I0WAU4_9ASPA|nr:uncharacterized protein OsI_027940-like [Dendrobium catenatum]PKU72778.1 Uncharacterized protein MA16_Dca017479 [Dendrobium catenatum]